mgnify:CR=1 FL=1
MKFTQVRNATVIVDYNDNKFLIDPWLGPKDYMAGFEAGINSNIRQPRVELPFAIDKIVDVDAVILTHFHPDHIDEYALKALRKDIKFFVQSEKDMEIIKGYGFTNLEIVSENGTEYNHVMLYKTNCQHGKREIIKPLCESVGMPYESMGVVFKADNEKTLYIAGDTIWCDEVKVALDMYNPDIIVVNACAATVINGEHIIMNLEDIKQVLNHSKNSLLIASHMDTVSHLTLTREDIKHFINSENITNLVVPDDGETLVL